MLRKVQTWLRGRGGCCSTSTNHHTSSKLDRWQPIALRTCEVVPRYCIRGTQVAVRTFVRFRVNMQRNTTQLSTWCPTLPGTFSVPQRYFCHGMDISSILTGCLLFRLLERVRPFRQTPFSLQEKQTTPNSTIFNPLISVAATTFTSRNYFPSCMLRPASDLSGWCPCDSPPLQRDCVAAFLPSLVQLDAWLSVVEGC